MLVFISHSSPSFSLRSASTPLSGCSRSLFFPCGHHESLPKIVGQSSFNIVFLISLLILSMCVIVITFIADNTKLKEKSGIHFFSKLTAESLLSCSICLTVLIACCTFSFQAYQGTCVTKKLKIFLTMLPEVIIIECVSAFAKI